MKIVVCPHCKAVEFLDKKGNPLWIKLSSEEENALDVIAKSKLLLLIVGGSEELPQYCDECTLIELN